MNGYKYNITSSRNYAINSLKIIIFGVDPNEKFYVCYAMPDIKIVIFEWYQETSAEIVDIEPIEFLIEKIMLGYEVVDVAKTRSGVGFLKDTIYVKYRNLLRVHYEQTEYLDKHFHAFLKAAFCDNTDWLKKSMKKINDYHKIDILT